MIRGLFAVLAGILVGSFVVWLIDLPGNYLHPLPANSNPNDRDVLLAHVANAPLAAKLLVALAWAVGPLVGGWLAASLARRAKIMHSSVVGTVFLLLNAVTLFYLPLPLWLSAACLILPPLTSFAGGYLGTRPSNIF